MKPNGQKTVHLRVNFTDRSLVRPVFENLGHDSAIALSILRGRITQDEASFEIEITGCPQRVDDLLRQSAQWGASVGAHPVGVA